MAIDKDDLIGESKEEEQNRLKAEAEKLKAEKAKNKERLRLLKETALNEQMAKEIIEYYETYKTKEHLINNTLVEEYITVKCVNFYTYSQIYGFDASKKQPIHTFEEISLSDLYRFILEDKMFNYCNNGDGELVYELERFRLEISGSQPQKVKYSFIKTYAKEAEECYFKTYFVTFILDESIVLGDEFSDYE